jgi:HlyD family secretion protein
MKLKLPGSSNKGGRPRRWILTAVFVLLAAGGVVWYSLSKGTTAQAQSSSKTATVTQNVAVKRGDLNLSATGSGSLVANQSVDLSFSTTGLVTELNVKIGDMVKKGQVLARMDKAEVLDASLSSAQLQLVQAQNALADLKKNAGVALAQAHQDLITAQQAYDTALTANQRMAYARCSDEMVAQDKEKYDEAVARLKIVAQRNYGSATWIDDQNVVDTTLANYNYCATYTSDEKVIASSDLEVAKVALQLATDNYNTLSNTDGVDPQALALDNAKIKAAQDQLDKVQKDLDGITLTAPIDGKVVYLAAAAGTIVDTSKFITVADISSPTVDVSIDETDMDKLVVGSVAKATFDSLPDQVFSGKVTRVDPQLTTSGSYQVLKGLVKLDIDKTTPAVEALPLGVNATVIITNQEVKNALLVPVKALKALGNNQYQVKLVESGGQTKLQTVQVGVKDTTYAQVLSGLKEGDLVQIEVTQVKASSTSSSGNAAQSGPPDGGMAGPPQ